MLPKLFHIGEFFIPSYGILVALGFLLGLWITVRLAKRAGLPTDKVTNLVIYCALAGLAGAKLFMFIFDWRTFWEHPGEIFSLSTLRAAGVYQGGFLLAFVVAVIYVRRAKLPFLQTCDIFSPGIAIAHTIGRLGCLAAGCCWGRPTNVPWAITFHNRDAQEMSGTPLDVPLHPTQIYEAFANALIFAFLYWRVRRTHAAGTVFGWYLVLYSSARFVIEFFRFHEQSTWLTLSLTQWISLVTFAAGIWLLAVAQVSRPVSAVKQVSRPVSPP